MRSRFSPAMDKYPIDDSRVEHVMRQVAPGAEELVVRCQR